MRFGMYDGRTHTLEEVGQIFGVTRERIRQIENKAIRKLRHPVARKKNQGLLLLRKPGDRSCQILSPGFCRVFSAFFRGDLIF